MEVVSNKHIEGFPATTLYLEDLLELFEILSSVCAKVELQTGEFKISDSTELGALAAKFSNGRFPDLYFQGQEPYLKLELRTFGARAYISEDSALQRGVISKAMEVLQRRRKIAPEHIATALATAAVALAIWQLAAKSYLIAAPFLVASWALHEFSRRLHMNSVVVVRTSRSSETTPFFKRKKDDIVLSTVSAVLAAAATYLFTKLGYVRRHDKLTP